MLATFGRNETRAYRALVFYFYYNTNVIQSEHKRNTFLYKNADLHFKISLQLVLHL